MGRWVFADPRCTKRSYALSSCGSLINFIILQNRTEPLLNTTSRNRLRPQRVRGFLFIFTSQEYEPHGSRQQAGPLWWRGQTQLVCLFVPPARNIHVKLNYPRRTDHFPLLAHALVARTLFTQVRQAARGDYWEHVGKEIFATWQETHFLGRQRPRYLLYAANQGLKITSSKLSYGLWRLRSSD